MAFEPVASPWLTFVEATCTGLAGGLAPDFRVDNESVMEPGPVVLGLGFGLGLRL